MKTRFRSGKAETGHERVDALEDRKRLYAGFGDTFSRAIEFVATPILFWFIGHLLDGRFGTGNLIAVTLAAVAAVGMFLRSWYAYVEAMKVEEAKAPWHNR